MSHCNISMRDRSSSQWMLFERCQMQEAKIKLLESHLVEVESNLRSVFERVRDGEDVYLCYPDGTTIHIAARAAIAESIGAAP